jgi:hypothetical protein
LVKEPKGKHRNPTLYTAKRQNQTSYVTVGLKDERKPLSSFNHDLPLVLQDSTLGLRTQGQAAQPDLPG